MHVPSCFQRSLALSIGTLSNEDGTRTKTAQKNHLSGSLSTSLWRSLGFCFFAINFVNRKTMECFSMKLNKYWESFCCYVLVKKGFSRCNFSDNSVLVLNSVHSNVQLYLLLFFAFVFGVGSPHCLRSLLTALVKVLKTHSVTLFLSKVVKKSRLLVVTYR